MTVLVDDQTLAAMLRSGSDEPGGAVYTTGLWYLRLCQAVVRGAGGSLSQPFLELPAERRERTIRTVLELPDHIGVLPWRELAPVMAQQLDGPGRRLNLLGREALAAATLLDAEVVMAPGNVHVALRAALDELGVR